MHHSSTSFDDDGRPVLTTDFDWEQVERNLENEKAQLRKAYRKGEINDEHFEQTAQLIGTLLRWVWQKGKKDKRGVAIRSLIICWLYLDELRPLTMAELARGFGMKKQSLGRWVDVLKKDFPMIKNKKLHQMV